MVYMTRCTNDRSGWNHKQVKPEGKVRDLCRKMQELKGRGLAPIYKVAGSDPQICKSVESPNIGVGIDVGNIDVETRGLGFPAVSWPVT